MINVTKTYLPERKRYIDYINKIFDSGWITNNGQFVIELERKLIKYLKVKNVILVNNGTIALQVLYKALNLKGEIITTPFSFVATTSSLVWEGLKPIFSDINPYTFLLDPKSIEKKINSNTSAILAVHVFGNPCEIEMLEKIANKFNLKLIFDAAHAFGVKYRNKSIANFGNASTFSLHATKIFHTIEGGAIVTNDDKLAEKIRLMINFGFSGYDKIDELGINGKMNEFQAAMGLCILEQIKLNIKLRERIYLKYLTGFKNNEKIQLQEINTHAKLNFSYFPIVLRSEKDLIILKNQLAQQGIYPRRYFYPSLDTLIYIKSNHKMLHSLSLSKRILCLPMYETLPVSIIEKIIKITNSIIK